MKYLFLFFCFLIVVGCAPESANQEETISPKQETTNFVKTALKGFKGDIDYEIERGSSANSFVATLEYELDSRTLKNKEYESDIRSLKTEVINLLDKILRVEKIEKVKITITNSEKKLVSSPKGDAHIITSKEDTFFKEIASVELEKESLNEYKEKFEDYKTLLYDYVEISSFFKVQHKLRTTSRNIKNIQVGQIEEEENIILDIRYEPTTIRSKDDFEEDFALILRTAFEEVSEVTQISLVAQSNEVDVRSGTEETSIAKYETSRESFNEIMNNWDDLKFKIIDEIEYTDVFLVDMISESNLISIEGENNLEIVMDLEKDYVSALNSISILEKDTKSIVSNVFRYFEDIDQIKIDFNYKIQEEESEEVNKLIKDGYSLSATRSGFDELNLENLNDQQFSYNFDAVWNEEIIKLQIKEFSQKFFERSKIKWKDSLLRNSDIDGEDVTITFDGCAFEDFFDKADDENSGESLVADEISKMAEDFVFELHPPYVDTLIINLERVYLDQTGNEEVEDLGTMSFTREDEATFWFRGEDFEEDELFDVDNDLDIDSDEVLCQR